MAWFLDFFSTTPKENIQGLCLDCNMPYWELSGTTTLPVLLQALVDFLPDGSVLYFEIGCPDRTLLNFLNDHDIAEQVHIAVGTKWPKAEIYHIPATQSNLEDLAELMKHRKPHHLAIHFHAYCSGKMIFEWYDAFDETIWISGDEPEQKIREFANILRMHADKRN